MGPLGDSRSLEITSTLTRMKKQKRGDKTSSNSRVRFGLLVVLIVSLLAAACTGGSDTAVEDETATDSGDIDSDSDTGDEEDGELVNEIGVGGGATDTLALVMHPSGLQAQVRQMSFESGSTTVLLQLVNGREFKTQQTVERTQTALFDASGNEYALAEPIENFELAEGSITELALQFDEVDAEAGPFRLRYNFHDDDEGLDENSPGFEIDGIDLTTGVPALPADFGIADTANHEFGMQARIFGMAFTETSTAVSLEIINNGRQQASWSAGRYASFLEDDLGNRYQLELGAEPDYNLRIEDEDRQSGVVVFAGRMHPDATSVKGVFNNEGDPDGSSLRPRIEFGPYNLDGSTPPAGGSINPITEAQQFTHANSADFVMNEIVFSETGTVVNVVVENDFERQISLDFASSTMLIDDLGNEYALLAEDDTLDIPSGAGLDAKLSFPGAIDLNATTIEVAINNGLDERGGNTADGFPEVHFGPFDITRAAGVPGEPPTNPPAITTIGTDALEGSEASPLDLIFDEFDGRLVSDGVLLTLPQDILFDSGSSTLRSGSSDAVNKIVQVTEFYEGDPMTVIGHTDSDGDDESNQALSIARAESVVDALVAAGADSSTTSAEGRGETEPVDTNDTDEGKQANRRVEVFFETDRGLPE